MTLTPSVNSKNRIEWLDMLRGIAVLLMIEAHLLHVGLQSYLKQSSFYQKLDFYHGTVAPGFLFCSGLAFWISLKSGKIQKYPWIYLRRIAFIFLVANWLNLPFFSLRQCLNNLESFNNFFFSSDILHTVAFASFLAFGFSLLKLSSHKLLILFSFFTLFIYFISPTLGTLYIHHKIPFFAYFFEPFPDSKFPPFPYMGHFFAGICWMGFYELFPQNKKKFLIFLLLLSLLGPKIIFWVKDNIEKDFSGQWWHVSAGHSFLRLSGVVCAFSIAGLLSLRYRFQGILSRFLQEVGQESLFYYVTHIAIIYGTVVNKGLRSFAYENWGFAGISILYLLILAFLYPLAQVWHEFKKNSPAQLRTFLGIAFGLSFFLFLTLP